MKLLIEKEIKAIEQSLKYYRTNYSKEKIIADHPDDIAMEMRSAEDFYSNIDGFKETFSGITGKNFNFFDNESKFKAKLKE